ncbi:hypothetical protein DBA29_22535 [Xenophilus aerolatus]|nr:hypothetical protein [Xenophilus aerolatus]
MKRAAALLLAVLALSGCAAPASRCQLLPDPPQRATRQQLENYTAQVIRLYGECAGGPAASVPNPPTSPSTPQ